MNYSWHTENRELRDPNFTEEELEQLSQCQTAMSRIENNIRVSGDRDSRRLIEDLVSGKDLLKHGIGITSFSDVADPNNALEVAHLLNQVPYLYAKIIINVKIRPVGRSKNTTFLDSNYGVFVRFDPRQEKHKQRESARETARMIQETQNRARVLLDNAFKALEQEQVVEWDDDNPLDAVRVPMDFSSSKRRRTRSE